MTVAIERRSHGLVPVLVLGVAALALRGVGTFSFVVPLLAAIGVAGVQPRTSTRSDVPTWIVVTAVGAAAFAVVRVAMPVAAVPVTGLGLFASVVAGSCEEVVFRRGLYGALERLGALPAIVLAAAAFGVVHVPMYGWSVVPLDVAAGLILGWQRWASRTWTSPAATHALANVLGSI